MRWSGRSLEGTVLNASWLSMRSISRTGVAKCSKAHVGELYALGGWISGLKRSLKITLKFQRTLIASIHSETHDSRFFNSRASSCRQELVEKTFWITLRKFSMTLIWQTNYLECMRANETVPQISCSFQEITLACF